MVGRGRRKTGMKLIEEKTARDVCFCKRRAGLFKKAKELSVLCGAKVGVLVFSRSGNPITFDAPTLQTLIDRQLRHGDDISSVETESPPPPDGADKGEALLFQGSMAEKTSPFWWERADVGSMTLDELKTFASSLSVAREERLKQLKDGGHAFDAQEKMMDANVFPCDEPSSIHGSNEVPLMTDILVGEQSNDDQMKSHRPLSGGEYCWNAAADAAGQMMEESFFIPNSWPPSGIEEQMLMDENFFIPNICPPAGIEEQMLMDENFFIPSRWPSSTDIGGGPQMPISLEDEPSPTDGRQLVAPNLLPCKPSAEKNTSFQPLTWSDLFMQHQWI